LCSITKINDEEFELVFNFIGLNKIDIKVNIIPINCDHNILWMIEAFSGEYAHTYGMISYVDGNTGLWFIENVNRKNKNFSGLVSDINSNKKPLNEVIAKRLFSFSLGPHSNTDTNIIKILAKKI